MPKVQFPVKNMEICTSDSQLMRCVDSDVVAT